MRLAAAVVLAGCARAADPAREQVVITTLTAHCLDAARAAGARVA